MAELIQEEGERQLARQSVRNTRDGVFGYLILTNRRVCLIGQESKPGFLTMLFGLLGAAISAATARSNITAQIRREDIATIERSGDETIKLASKGEGYGRIWFEVSLAKFRADEWMGRLQRWAAGDDEPPPEEPRPDSLPVAKLVKRD
jgi:hypothetical protein